MLFRPPSARDGLVRNLYVFMCHSREGGNDNDSFMRFYNRRRKEAKNVTPLS